MALETMDDVRSQELFQRLKEACVPLMGNSLLTVGSARIVSTYLADLLKILREVQASNSLLKPSVVGYVLTPLMTILRRNPGLAIPDQVLERILLVLSVLCESWWWTCQVAEWEQLFMLCGSVLGGVDSKAKGKSRDDETKAAAALALRSVLYPNNLREAVTSGKTAEFGPRISERLGLLREHAQTDKFTPILGQTLDWALTTATSSDLSLQVACLNVLDVLCEHYLPDHLVPSVLPGVVSTMSKVALGLPSTKGRASGDSVRVALQVMEISITRAIGDDICLKEGAIQVIDDLEDLTRLGSVSEDQSDGRGQQTRPYGTVRTSSWLKGTASQLHIALNALTPLVSHPNPTALRAMSQFSQAILITTIDTLPLSQPLLLSFILSISLSEYDSVSLHSRRSLHRLLSASCRAQRPLLQALAQITKDSLSSLPRFLISGSDAKVQHSAGLVKAICRLADEILPSEDEDGLPYIPAVSHAVGKLLGPAGGIERWGWGLLSVLEFSPPNIAITEASMAQLTLEQDPEGQISIGFPLLELKATSSKITQVALTAMFRAMGDAAGNQCLFAVEWFLGIDRGRKSARAVSALWCAARLLEGASGFALDGEAPCKNLGKSLLSTARAIAKSVADSWDTLDEGDVPPQDGDTGRQLDPDENQVHEHITGLITIRAPHEIGINANETPKRTSPRLDQITMYRVASLQLLAVGSGILQSRFTPLLLYTIYPILHSIVSATSFLSQTGLATLQCIARNASYASPANLLLSNFDYALDAVSRRLTRHLLDVDASKALILLARLVGKDVVHKARDVVEACFDRLDEFHGYEVIVDGLVEVLNEVVRAVDFEDERLSTVEAPQPTPFAPAQDAMHFREFFNWFHHRGDSPDQDNTDYGPAPRGAWANSTPVPEDGSDSGTAALTTNITENEPFTETQILTKQIITRSMFFLTHGSPFIRVRIINLLSRAVPVLPVSALMPSIHQAWPFILNRLADPQPFVASAAAVLIEALALHHGDFMFRRIWDDVWPRFRSMLGKLEASDRKSALVRRQRGSVGVGTETAHADSHRLYRALLRTMTASAQGVQGQDSSTWEVIIAFRRFLHDHAHEELQKLARELYIAVGKGNEDAVWLGLHATMGSEAQDIRFLAEPQWNIRTNVHIIMGHLENA